MFATTHSDPGEDTAPASTPDPLLFDVPLPLRGRFRPRGFALDLATNSEEVLACARDAWDQYPELTASSPIRFRIGVRDNSDDADVPPAALPRGMGNLLAFIHDVHNWAIADVARGFAFGWFTRALLRDRARFRYHFLEPVAYLMLESRHLTPIHAGCVALNGRGILLCGESGAGKTSLTYSLARRGWTYVCDDSPCLLRDRERTVVGRPGWVRFRNSAKLLFPELDGYEPVIRPNGKPDLEISTSELGLSTAYVTTIDALVFLNRVPGSIARLNPFSKSEAARRLLQTYCWGDPEIRRAHADCAARLLELPVVELRYSDFDEADDVLRRLVTQGAAR